MRSGRECGKPRVWVIAGLAVLLLARPAAACVGDCDGDAHVGVDELVVGINIDLGVTTLDACQAIDNDRSGTVSVDELVLALSKSINGCGGGPATQRLYSPENNQLKVYDLATGAAEVYVPAARGTLNGQICLVPGQHGNFLAGDDTGQPQVRPGWGIYSPDGTFLQKLTVPTRENENKVPDPIGCAFDADGRLFTTAIVGQPGFNGQLNLFFPPSYTESCILDIGVGTPGSLAVDEGGNVYVAGLGGVSRYRPPFPNSPAECETVKGTREDFISDSHLSAALGIARAPNGNWYVSNVYLGAGIFEYDANGTFVRELFPPDSAGNAAGLAVDEEGTLYYSDLGLRIDPRCGSSGAPCPIDGAGTLRKITFDANGNPAPPELIAYGLTFPDSLGILPVRPPEWLQLGGSLRRTYFNGEEKQITSGNVDRLIAKWRYYTGGIITAAPIVAHVNLPEEGPTEVVFVSSWDGNLYALRAANGSRVWTFTMKPHPGSSYPQASSPTVEWLGDRQVVYIGGGMTMYCVDAVTGKEIWEFDAGTGCTTCGFDPTNPRARERNEILSSPAVFDGRVYFGLDVDDSGVDKGGFFAVRADDGRLAWYFDVATGPAEPCRPRPEDDIHKFDGYHSAQALTGLPEDFFTTRPGCNFDRTGNTCGNVWSSASIDTRRRLLITASSNCDTEDCSRQGAQCDATGDDPTTPETPPPMKPFEEAVFALTLDGFPVWRWRPREIDNDDLSFGAVPNLVEVQVGDEVREVVGVGDKSGTYYLLDREGENQITGVTWESADKRELPYWETNLVPGGAIGGIIASAAVGDGKIFLTTAVGTSLADPQRPAAWALNASDGTVAWSEPNVNPSYAPTSAIHGLMFTGELLTGSARIHAAASGAVVGTLDTMAGPAGLSSVPTVVGGTIYTGGGNGQRGGRLDIASRSSAVDTPLSAFCVEGTPGCEPACPDEDLSACTFEFRVNGTCQAEPAPDTLDCCLGGGGTCNTAQIGVCHTGVCVPKS